MNLVKAKAGSKTMKKTFRTAFIFCAVVTLLVAACSTRRSSIRDAALSESVSLETFKAMAEDRSKWIDPVSLP